MGRAVTGRINLAIVSLLVGRQPKERLRLIDARSSIAQALILARPDKKLGLSRKSVGIKLEVEGKTSFVLWQKNISKQ